MKLSLFLGAALLCAPAALLAQDTQPSPPQNDMSAQQMPQGSPATDPNASAPTGGSADAAATSPDSAVPNDAAAPATAPAGGNAMPAPEAKTDYPVCSKTVQDSCINPGEAKGRKTRRHR